MKTFNMENTTGKTSRYFIDTEFIEGSQPKKFLGHIYGQSKPTIDL